MECFLPIEKVRSRDRHGRFEWLERCPLPGYLFVHADKETFNTIVRQALGVYPAIQIRRSDQFRSPMIVPDRQMASFIIVSGTEQERILYLDPERLNFEKGDRVRVIGGTFCGVEGVFMQIGGKHEKRVVIQLPGLIAVATAAIPAALVEKIPEVDAAE